MLPLQILITLLLALACMAWVWILLVAVRSRSILPRLDDIDLPAMGRWPSISIIVPARDAVKPLTATVESLLKLDYPELEILLVDDRSEDGTSRLVDHLAQCDPRVRSLHLGKLPGGWLGKNHALHVASSQARGEWLLFTEADVRFQRGALRKAVRWAAAAYRDHVTLVPDVRAKGFLSSAVSAACTRLMFVGFRPWAVCDADSDAYLGIGAFNLVRRESLARCGGLANVRLDFADDVALARALRDAGARSGVAVAEGLLSVGGYDSLPRLARAFERRAWPLMGCSLPRLSLVGACFGLLELAPWICLIPFGIPMLHGLGVIGTIAQLAASAGMAWHRGRPVGPALAAPVGALVVLFLWLRSGIVGTLAGGVRSRESFYPADMLRRGSTVVLPTWTSDPIKRARSLLTLPRPDEDRAWA